MKIRKEKYKSSDIKLDMEVKDNKTLLKYHGTATTLKSEAVDFDEKVICDFAIDETKITYKR